MEMTAVMDRPPFPPRDAEGLELAPWLAFQPQVPAQPAPAAETPAPAPTPEPVKPQPPTAEELAEKRRAAAAVQAIEKLRRRAEQIRMIGRRWSFAVILISAVITLFGSGNAHAVFRRHDTADPWAWMPYPALEAALIVEIQVGATLAEHKVPVKFWGAALRFVTAFAAVTVCIYGPAENGDWGGACLHAIGPIVQFFLAEFLARAREHFRQAADSLLDKADGREHSARVPVAPGKDRGPKTAKRSPKTTHAGAEPVSKTTEEGPAEDRSPEIGTGPALVLTPQEKKAIAAIQRKGLRVSKRTVIEEIRAGGGAIGTTRALAIAREWGPGSGGPELQIVHEKEA
jgi:hypothetical protein